MTELKSVVFKKDVGVIGLFSREGHGFQLKNVYLFRLLYKWLKNDNLCKFFTFKTELEAFNTSLDGNIFDFCRTAATN